MFVRIYTLTQDSNTRSSKVGNRDIPFVVHPMGLICVSRGGKSGLRLFPLWDLGFALLHGSLDY